MKIEPPLKWAGGKRWLIQNHSWAFASNFENYVEPFLGGAAIFLALRPQHAVLSDSNRELITTYRALRDGVGKVWEHLKAYADRHSDAFYYVARADVEGDRYQRAARFLYLNRTCWNGLYRVNLRGEFNVPRGTKNRVLFGRDQLAATGALLRGKKLVVSDFEPVLERAGRGSFVFLDPPYTVLHNTNGFLKYNETIFSWADQIRLKEAAERAAERGAKILISNARHQSIERLYSNVGFQHVVERASVISGSREFRKPVEELLIQLGYETRPTNSQMSRIDPRADVRRTRH